MSPSLAPLDTGNQKHSEDPVSRTCPVHHKNIHDLMTGAINIERPRKPALGDTSCVDGCSRKIRQPKAHEISHRLLLILYRPTVNENSMKNRNECRKAKERIHSYTDGTIHRATKLSTHGEDGTAKRGKGRLSIMSAFEKEKSCETLLSHR